MEKRQRVMFMIKAKIRYFSVLSLVFLSSRICYAGPTSYQCTFMEEYQLEDGQLILNKDAKIIGENFSVDRNTGNAITPVSAIWPHSESRVTVLSHGNTENSFVVTYVSNARNGGVFLASLRIEEYTESSKKPFVVLANYYVYTGFCM